MCGELRGMWWMEGTTVPWQCSVGKCAPVAALHHLPSKKKNSNNIKFGEIYIGKLQHLSMTPHHNNMLAFGIMPYIDLQSLGLPHNHAHPALVLNSTFPNCSLLQPT